MEFIMKMKEANRLYRHSSVIRSINVTYTKRPKKVATSVTTFSPKPKADSKTPLYTNVIVTIIIGDGIHRTLWMLFSRDPKMAKEQKDTDRGKRKRVGSELKKALKKCNIIEDRTIIHVESKIPISLRIRRCLRAIFD